MKRIFSVAHTSKSTGIALLIARMSIGGLMLSHGIPKLLMLFSGAPIQFPPVLGMNAEVSLALAVFAEVFCSVLLITGFASRLVVIPLAATMLVAVYFHAGDPFSAKEPALLYLLFYVVLLLAGGGKYSIDYLIGKSQALAFAKQMVQLKKGDSLTKEQQV
jgi:putative oxidoreductase